MEESVRRTVHDGEYELLDTGNQAQLYGWFLCREAARQSPHLCDRLLEENFRRTVHDDEYELLDTGNQAQLYGWFLCREVARQ